MRFAMLGLSGVPGPVVTWRRNGVPAGGQTVTGFVVPCAQSYAARLKTKIWRVVLPLPTRSSDEAKAR